MIFILFDKKNSYKNNSYIKLCQINIFTEIGKLWRKHREVQHTHHGEDLQLRGTWGEVGTTSLAHSKTDNAT